MLDLKEFGDKQFFTVDRTDEEDKYLVVVTSDKIVAEYYIYDVEKTVLLYYINYCLI